MEGFNPIMPDVSRTLSDDQIWALVAFLQAQGGEVTVSAEDVAAAAEEGGAAEPAANGGANVGGADVAVADDPVELMRELGCFACHQLGDEGNTIGPPFTDVGARRDAGYIRESILDPGADLVRYLSNQTGQGGLNR